MKKKQGFILVFTVLILSVILTIGGIFVNTILKEIAISRDDAESLKAFYAADTGIECVRYYNNKYDAFDSKSTQNTYNCGIGSSFTAPNNSTPTTDCTAQTYTFRISGFANGACTDVTVNMVPRTINIGGSPTIVCDAQVVSDGKNSCTLTGSKLVERTRWETM